MARPLTVNDLLLFCKEEIKKGNGTNTIMLSDDEEGTNYHYCWYGFLSPREISDDIQIFFDNEIAVLSDTILLG